MYRFGKHAAGRLQSLAEVGRGPLTEQEQARLLTAIARQEASDRAATACSMATTVTPARGPCDEEVIGSCGRDKSRL